jgi:hypothetical protein
MSVTRRLILLVAGLVLVLPAGALAAGAQDLQLARASALWSSQHVRSYSYRVTVGCFCAPAYRRPTTVTVRGGKSHVSKYVIKQLRTIPAMFRLIRQTLADPNAGAVTVSYDKHRGFPRSVRLDPIRNAIDDEVSWTIDRFRAG